MDWHRRLRWEPESPPAGEDVEQWGVFETSVKGPATGNPFVDVTFSAKFTLGHRTVEVPGFYDGAGTYKVRFSPDSAGKWTFETAGSAKELSGHAGAFTCSAAKADGQIANRGAGGDRAYVSLPACGWDAVFSVRDDLLRLQLCAGAVPPADAGGVEDGGVQQGANLSAAEGAGDAQARWRCRSSGWARRRGTRWLGDSSTSRETFDLARLNPEYFRIAEERIMQLQSIGVQADVILFHPYDSWGFKNMGAEADDRYLRYAVARLSAYRNVWWVDCERVRPGEDEDDEGLGPFLPDCAGE